MKYGRYLENKMKPEWRSAYLDYKGLKTLIKEAQADAATQGETTQFSPRTTSLTVQRVNNRKDSAGERFFKRLEEEVGFGRNGGLGILLWAAPSGHLGSQWLWQCPHRYAGEKD